MGDKQKRAVIIGASRVNKTALKACNITEEDFVICCDGGYNHCLKYGIKPNVVLGDFDSFLGEILDEDIEVIKLDPIKDDTDTIYAVRFAANKGFNSIGFLGVMGGRPDHTMASIQTLLFAQELGVKSMIYDNKTTAFLLYNGSVVIPPCKKSYLSVFSLDNEGVGVYIENGFYPLNNYTMTNSFPIGVSNKFTDKPITLSVKKGRLLVMITLDK